VARRPRETARCAPRLRALLRRLQDPLLLREAAAGSRGRPSSPAREGSASETEGGGQPRRRAEAHAGVLRVQATVAPELALSSRSFSRAVLAGVAHEKACRETARDFAVLREALAASEQGPARDQEAEEVLSNAQATPPHL